MSIEDLLQRLGETLDTNWATTTLMNIIDTVQTVIFAGGVMLYELIFNAISSMSLVDSRIEGIGAIITFSTNLATTILVIFFLKQVLTNYVLNVDGEADADPMQSLVNISFTLAVINCGEELYQIANKASNLILNGLNGAIINAGTVKSSFSNMLIDFLVGLASTILTLLTSMFGSGLLLLGAILIAIIWVCVMIVLFVILLFKMVFRSAELFIFRVLFPLFACDLISPSKEMWKPFISMYLTTFFGFLVQYLCLMISLLLIYKFTTFENVVLSNLWNPVLATAFLYFACKAPKWLQKFTYSTGAGQTLGGGMRGMMYPMMNMTRFIK